MKDELNIKNRIIKIMADNKLPNEIREELNAIYKDYEDISNQCCTSLIRIDENEQKIINVVQYIKKDTKDMEEFINFIARKRI